MDEFWGIIGFILIVSLFVRINKLEEDKLSPGELKEKRKKQKEQQEEFKNVLWWIIGITIVLVIGVLLFLF
jgi:heme/copper-type cytochrome/quinol oxidase subunit 2